MSIFTAALPLPVSSDDLLFFTKHLGVLVTSGIPISEALSILVEQSKNPSLTKVIISLQNNVTNGKTLGESIAKHPRVFSSYYHNIISIGEESGTLDKNLNYLSTELEKNLEFKRKLQGILLYPSIVILIAIFVAGGISIFVLPQLVDLFTSLNIDLPTTTKILLWSAKFSRQYGVVVFLLVISAFFGIVLSFKSNTARKILDPIILHMPIAGRVVQNMQVATICRNLGLMLKSGLPINRAFMITRDSTTNAVFWSYLNSLYAAVQSGKNLESELKDPKYHFMPASLGRMLGVGEQSGTLDDSFIYLGDYYAEEVNTITKQLPTILEPILLIAIAGIVLFVALAIISPIYQFTGSIRR